VANLIALDKWCEDTGFPKSTFRGWKGRLQQGKHYFVLGRVTSVDPEEIDKWLRDLGTEKELGKPRSQSTAKGSTKDSSSQIVTLDFAKQ
jgi:hypothetical protein